jgi:hypothetical protein
MFPTFQNPQNMRKYDLESRRCSSEKYSLVKVRTPPRIRMREYGIESLHWSSEKIFPGESPLSFKGRKYGLESRRWSGEKYSLVKVRTAPRIRMREATAVREMRGRRRELLPPSVCSSEVTSPAFKGTVSVTVDLL